MALERKIKLYGFDLNDTGRIKISSVMHHMQQLAREDLEQYDLSYEKMREHNYVFVLTKMLFDFVRLPDIYSDALILKTIPIKTTGATFFRDFYLTDGGETIMKASTTWVLIDFKARRPLRPSVLYASIPTVIEEAVGFEPERRILPPEVNLTCCDVRRVYRSMLDENNHLNNCVYADLIYDCATREHGFEGTRLQIDFLGEAHLGDELRLYRSPEGAFEYFMAENITRGVKCFEAKLFDTAND